jgi:hypothetical protein
MESKGGSGAYGFRQNQRVSLAAEMNSGSKFNSLAAHKFRIFGARNRRDCGLFIEGFFVARCKNLSQIGDFSGQFFRWRARLVRA